LTLSAREAVKDAGDLPPSLASPSASFGGAGPRSLKSPLASFGGAGLSADLARQKAGELRGRLAEANRPLVVIGLGILTSNAQRIRRWVTEWDLPVAVTPKVKGIVDETSRNFVGVVSGM